MTNETEMNGKRRKGIVRKSLRSIVLAGALALGGCSGEVDDPRVYSKGNLGNEQVKFKIINGSEFYFKGNLGNEQVEFERIYPIYGNWGSVTSNRLRIVREDGKIITYIDLKNDLKLEGVRVGDITYVKDTVGRQALKLAQQQFDDYLTKILEHKRTKALDDIRIESPSKEK